MKPARELFTEVTDIDNRLLKTFIWLFRDPQRVVGSRLEGEHTYTKPIRYLLFTSTIFIVWRFLYDNYVEGLFFNDPEIDDWYLPARIAKASNQFNNLSDTFFPFQILLFVVPIVIVLLKVFFIRKSWKEARYTALYSFGQFWVALTVLVPLFPLGSRLPVIMIAFALAGFFFRKLLSKNVWVGLAKWMALGFLITIWFYEVSLPITQWALIKITLRDRYYEANNPKEPLEEIEFPVTADYVQSVRRDPNDRILTVVGKEEGLLVQCYQSGTTLLWQTLLPEVKKMRKALSVQLSSNERGFLILEDVGINAHAVLISSIGKILFTKIYKKEIVLNGGDLVNETLILTGGKSNGEGIIPFIDVLRLKFNSGKGFFELTEERTHFLPGVGNRLDDLYVLNYSPGSFDLVVSKYETAKAKASYVVLMDLNRVSIMRVKVDSTLRILWETEIFKRNSKYSPIRDLTFQMKYDPDYQRVVAFYSLADERSISAHLFSMDTLGKFELQKKIKINELTFLRDVYSAREGIYFCGWTEVGIDTPFLGFGQQGLFGFVANDGRVSSVHVGRDRQGYNLSFYKIRADSSLNVWATRTRDTFVGITNKWELMKFDRPLF